LTNDGMVDFNDFAHLAVDIFAYQREQPPDQPPSDPNLVAHWKFDEGEGDAVGDSTSSSYDGVRGGSPGATWTTDAYNGNALDFDGIDEDPCNPMQAENTDWVRVEDPCVGPLAYMTLSLHMKMDAYQEGVLVAGFWGADQEATPGAFDFAVNGDGFLTFSWSAVEVFFAGGEPYPLPTGQWTHVVLVVDDFPWEGDEPFGRWVTIYVDGLVYAEFEAWFWWPMPPVGDFPGIFDYTGMTFGCFAEEGTYYYRMYDGILDDIRIYDYAPSDWETIIPPPPAPPKLSPPLPGDLDRDGNVDFDDVVLLSEDWLKQTSWH